MSYEKPFKKTNIRSDILSEILLKDKIVRANLTIKDPKIKYKTNAKRAEYRFLKIFFM